MTKFSKALNALFMSNSASIEDAHERFIQCLFVRCFIESGSKLNKKKKTDVDIVVNDALADLNGYADSYQLMHAIKGANNFAALLTAAVDAYFAQVKESPPFTDLLTHEYLDKGYAEALGLPLMPTHDDQLADFERDVVDMLDAMSGSPSIPLVHYNCGLGNGILKQLAVYNRSRKKFFKKLSVHLKDPVLTSGLGAFAQILAYLVVHPLAAIPESMVAHVGADGEEPTKEKCIVLYTQKVKK